MNYNGQDMDNPMEDIAKDMGKKAANKGKEVGKKIGREIGKQIKKVAVKVLKKMAMALIKGLIKVIAVAWPYILAAVVIVVIVAWGWYVLFESRGAESNYSLGRDARNEMTMTQAGYLQASKESEKNKAIVDFYTFYGKNAYYQIVGDDNTKLQKPDGTIRDEYNQEELFSIDPDFLFVLDDTVHKGQFRYPEQFVKPINYDPKTLTLKPLADNNGFIQVESDEYDDKTGLKTGNKIKSVHDYGFGSIFKYKQSEVTRTVEGNITQQDQFDDACKCMKPVAITPKPFKETMPGYPEKIWLMEKAVNFAFDVTLGYETQKLNKGGLKYGETTNPREDMVKIKTGTYDEYRTREVERVIDTEAGPVVVMVSESYLYKTHDVYSYREGFVYETRPMPAPQLNVENKYKTDYFHNYLLHYNAWIPDNVMKDFDFKDRMGGFLVTDINVGGGVGLSNFDKARLYLPIIEKYSKTYGADPYLILALMTQESGGDPKVNDDGLMQIVSDPMYRTVRAKNLDTGLDETFAVSSTADRQNPDTAIHWGVMYFMSQSNNFDGDPLKTLQSYNFNPSGYMKQFHPQEWAGTGWLNFREDARLYLANQEKGWQKSRSASYECIKVRDPRDPDLKKWGDSCYIENVLQYYAGDQFASLNNMDNNNASKDPKAQAKAKKAQEVAQAKYDDQIPKNHFEHPFAPRDIDWTLKAITTFDKKILFSDVGNGEGLSFWEDGFTTKSSNMSAEQFINLVPGADGFIPPVNIPNPTISSKFGIRVDPVTHVPGAMHKGVDVAIVVGTPLYAIADGTVDIAVGNKRNSSESYGNYVKITHKDGTGALYGHMDQVYVEAGKPVKQGQLIGTSGNSGKSTGPHLHFEFHVNGQPVDPLTVVVRPTSFKPVDPNTYQK